MIKEHSARITRTILLITPAWASHTYKYTRSMPEVNKEKYEPLPHRQPHPLALHCRASASAMAAFSSLLYFLALFCAFSTVRAQGLIVIRVDPVSGSDSECLSAQEVNETAGVQPEQACATINRALGDVACGGNASCAAFGRDRLSGVEIRLADGVHRLTGGLSRSYHQFFFFPKGLVTLPRLASSRHIISACIKHSLAGQPLHKRGRVWYHVYTRVVPALMQYLRRPSRPST